MLGSALLEDYFPVAQAGIDDHAPARFRLHVTNSRHHLDYDQGHWIFENLGNLGL